MPTLKRVGGWQARTAITHNHEQLLWSPRKQPAHNLAVFGTVVGEPERELRRLTNERLNFRMAEEACCKDEKRSKSVVVIHQYFQLARQAS